jgi:hypothetical protein
VELLLVLADFRHVGLHRLDERHHHVGKVSLELLKGILRRVSPQCRMAIPSMRRTVR